VLDFTVIIYVEIKPLERVGDKCSFKPITLINSKSAPIISAGVWLDKTLIKRFAIPLVITASLSAVNIILPSLYLARSQTFDWQPEIKLLLILYF